MRIAFLVTIMISSIAFAEDGLATRVRQLETENVLLKVRIQRLEYLVNKMIKEPITTSVDNVTIIQPETQTSRVRANYIVTYRDMTTQPIVTWEKNEYLISEFDRKRKSTQYTFHLENGTRIKVDVDKVNSISQIAQISN